MEYIETDIGVDIDVSWWIESWERDGMGIIARRYKDTYSQAQELIVRQQPTEERQQ